MEVKIEKGIDDTINSKLQIFHEKTRNGIVLFEKDKFPRVLDSSYDPLLFCITNCSFLIKNDLNGFFKLIEPFVEFNLTKNIFKMDSLNVHEFKKTLFNSKGLTGMELLEITPSVIKDDHSDFLNKIGANLHSLLVKNDDDSLNLQNFETKTNKKFDITFSNNLLHDNISIEEDKHSNVYRCMELYAILSNLTKKGGYSVHCHGNYISSLFETFFQFLGFKVVDYFRVESGPYNFGIVMRKFNNKKINKEEFDYLYIEMKKRNPIRYR